MLRDSRLHRDLSYCLGLVLCLAAADALEALHPFFNRQVWALFDNAVHALVGGAVVLPAVFTRSWPLRTVAWATVASSLIDLDHFVAARSLSILDAVSIGARPLSHSFLVAAALADGAGALARDRRVAAAVAAGLLCHLLRDASGSGAPLLWPMDGIQHVPTWVYLPVTGLVAFLFFRRREA